MSQGGRRNFAEFLKLCNLWTMCIKTSGIAIKNSISGSSSNAIQLDSGDGAGKSAFLSTSRLTVIQISIISGVFVCHPLLHPQVQGLSLFPLTPYTEQLKTFSGVP